MAKITRSASRTVRIASDPPLHGSMTVGALRNFVAALDAENIPGDATLTIERESLTMRLLGLQVTHTTPLPDTPGEDTP